MAESEIYADQFTMALGPYGCALTFGVTDPQPPGREGPLASELVTIRMSLEHLKAMAFVIRRQMVRYQQELNFTVVLPDKALEGLKISPDEWRAFWSE